ncbi:MAG: hypothetical protein G01um101418_480 [Parcubacteria group bacterium Gr01-1014_18]|nr:MAG: hypothetical protein Greene041636_526 [Parcubacteria group bacterium Greene0416_36]TSC81067.1 MAG: hypothetical protein G01um101418_480 [Parcubacteria group bacterium Gr01-1014_18]TSC98801.1 MAG: hypothetical protein Greene101420_551 [Parcubacteria group bacterium Greene1014_20]TSD06719.1 MAG: hypothetical protein Greene07142_640 [Parcubacteria group bacterium Greene0714_2]
MKDILSFFRQCFLFTLGNPVLAFLALVSSLLAALPFWGGWSFLSPHIPLTQSSIWSALYESWGVLSAIVPILWTHEPQTVLQYGILLAAALLLILLFIWLAILCQGTLVYFLSYFPAISLREALTQSAKKLSPLILVNLIALITYLLLLEIHFPIYLIINELSNQLLSLPLSYLWNILFFCLSSICSLVAIFALHRVCTENQPAITSLITAARMVKNNLRDIFKILFALLGGKLMIAILASVLFALLSFTIGIFITLLGLAGIGKILLYLLIAAISILVIILYSFLLAFEWIVWSAIYKKCKL